MNAPNKKAIARLDAMAKSMDKVEARRQTISGDARKGTQRWVDKNDAAILRQVACYLREQKEAA